MKYIYLDNTETTKIESASAAFVGRRNIWSYLKYSLLELLHFDRSTLKDKPGNNLQSTNLLPQSGQKEIKNVVGKLEIEKKPEQEPGADNKTAKWKTSKVAQTLNPQIFKGFVHGLIPGFRFKNFIESTEAEKIANEIRGFVEEYKTAPGVGRAGADTLVEHTHDFDEYAELAAIFRDPNISIPHRVGLADKIVGFLLRNTSYLYRPLQKNGVECFWGLFRQINTGAGWHLDNVTVDSDVFSDRKSIFQGSGVLHITTPKKGGETIIANRRAQENDCEFLNADGWTYDNKMFDRILKAEVPCATGDLIFLSTLNYHCVKPCLEVGAERISFSMFFVIFEDEPNIIYYYN